jgi:hypothetical protein
MSFFRTVRDTGHVFCAVLLASSSAPAAEKSEFPRPPLCTLAQAKAQPTSGIQAAFRSRFCQNALSTSCNVRWRNASDFLKMALDDERVTGVGTIAYMFGTIYAETAVKDLSPATEELIGAGNKSKGYVKDGFYGRGWVQLTYEDKYRRASKELGKDFVKQPSLVLEPRNAYEILFRGMSEGWIEVYRTSANGAVDRMVPIKLGDFVSDTKVDYGLARAVINANCKKLNGKCSPPNVEVAKGLYIPPSVSLDAGEKAATAGRKMEEVLCGVSVGKS